MNIHLIVLSVLTMILVMPLSTITLTKVGDILLFQDRENFSFLGPTSFGDIEISKREKFLSKILKYYCSNSISPAIIIGVHGNGNLQLSCILEENVQSAFIIKESLQEYIWTKKNVFFHGLEQKTSLLWTKLGKQNGIFKNPQIYSHNGILQLQPKINLQSFLFNTFKSSITRGIFEIRNLQQLEQIFFLPNSQFSSENFEFLLILEEDLDFLRFSEIKKSIFGPQSNTKIVVETEGRIIFEKFQQSTSNKKLESGIYLFRNQK